MEHRNVGRTGERVGIRCQLGYSFMVRDASTPRDPLKQGCSFAAAYAIAEGDCDRWKENR